MSGYGNESTDDKTDEPSEVSDASAVADAGSERSAGDSSIADGSVVDSSVVDSSVVNSATDEAESERASGEEVSEDEEQEEVQLISRKGFVLVLLGLLMAYPVVTFFDVWLASTQKGEVSGDAAVVLGAAQYNGQPSPVLKGRLDRASDLFSSGSVPLVVVTGGSQEGDLSTEANAGYAYLRREAGLDDTDLRLEVQGESTYESLAATARFLETEGVENVVVVTDPFHAKRATLIAEEVGLSVEVALTSNPASFERLVEETAAVGVGRIIGFRRLQQFL